MESSLPLDLVYEICLHLGVRSISRLCSTCSTLNKLGNSEKLWERLFKRDFKSVKLDSAGTFSASMYKEYLEPVFVWFMSPLHFEDIQNELNKVKEFAKCEIVFTDEFNGIEYEDIIYCYPQVSLVNRVAWENKEVLVDDKEKIGRCKGCGDVLEGLLRRSSAFLCDACSKLDCWGEWILERFRTEDGDKYNIVTMPFNTQISRDSIWSFWNENKRLVWGVEMD